MMEPEEKQEQFLDKDIVHPENSAAPIGAQTQNLRLLEEIETSHIHGPLVILYGPRNIGKTVTLLRLCEYLKKFDIRADESFWSSEDGYMTTINAFEEVRKNLQNAPPATGNINFLLLNVTYNGRSFCQILEAPGEHFFDAEKPDANYPPYFNRILNAEYRKVFLFFFATNMLKNERAKEQYCDKITKLINGKVSPQRDRVIIVCNKCDLEPYNKNGVPNIQQYKDHLYRTPAFGRMYEALKSSGFKQVYFVPFSAGDFNDLGKGKSIFTLSNPKHPQRLWSAITEALQGKLSLWQRIFGVS